jgi:epoxyqueuosine reductase
MSVMHNHLFTSHTIKQLAQELGFDFCGIAKAELLDDDAKRLDNWLKNGFHGSMQYMERNIELRIDPQKLVPGAKSVITILYNYYPKEPHSEKKPKISKYALGEDYHTVIRKKLNEFLFNLRAKAGDINGRGFVDSAPVLERSWAVRSGLGWIGKNGNLIHKKQGSFFFIATLITDLAVDNYDEPYTKDYCGSCTRCIDACPTDAILPDKTIRGDACISYFTIELKNQLIPEAWKDRFDDWIFGCDTCQDVCPWNRFSKPTREPAFDPNPFIINASEKDWFDLSENMFAEILKHSPLKRAGYEGIRRNLRFLQKDV